MSDQLYLSYWLRSFTEQNMLRHFGRMLQAFPMSRLAPGATLRVRAVELSEPILFERAFVTLAGNAGLLEAAAEFRCADCSYEVETAWDLWQYTGDWKLAPSPVRLSCFGPSFENLEGEHLRLDFGLDSNFLPQPELPDSLQMIRSNVKSLLHLVHTLDDVLAHERRRLWTESGDNFAERLQAALSGA